MGIKFDCTDIYGNEIVIPTPLIDELVDIVSGQKPSDRRPFAILILKYVNQQRTASEGKSEFDRAVAEMMLNSDVNSLWTFAEPGQHGLTCSLVPVKAEDGVERLTVKKVWGKSAPPLPPVTAEEIPRPESAPVVKKKSLSEQIIEEAQRRVRREREKRQEAL